MTTRYRLLFLTVFGVAVLFAVAAPRLFAAGPQFWTVATQAGFVGGKPTGVSVDAVGRLVVAPMTTTVSDLAAPQAWSLVRAVDGTWYAGTGGDGRVVRGRGTQIDTVLDLESSGIHAIALINGRVFAAGSPDGQVHVIEPDGSSRVFFDPPEPYVWALAGDSQGRLWVGAGHPAVVYRLGPDGTAETPYRPPARHVVSLALDASGRMFAGTDTPARLYRFDTGDRPFVVLESELTELRTIRSGADGSLFVAALTAAAGGDDSDTNVTGSVTITVGGTTTGTSSTSAQVPAAERRSVVYRVTVDGTWDSLWETSEAVYDVAPGADGSIMIATGPEGRLFQVSTAASTWGAATLVNAVDAKQITRLAADGTRMLALTANPGKVLAIGPAPAESPTYLSPVHDAKTLARWGTLRWEGAGSVSIETRSGNTEAPDDSWSPWAAPTPQEGGLAISSPSARFLQWRATLTPAIVAPVVTSVTVAYLPRNLRPVVTAVTVHPAGVVFQRPFSSEDGAIAGLDDAVADARRPPGPTPANGGPPSLGRRMFQRGLQTLEWKAEDPDSDRLEYTLLYRREGENAWLPLREHLTDPLFVWDTTSVPDGRYLVRVVANDSLSNTPDRTLTGDREGDAVDVDNTPPVITATVSGLRVTVRVVDGYSGVQRVDYSIGGQVWRALPALDGLADSRQEDFEVVLQTAADVDRLVIRATDAMQNVTSTLAGRR